MDNPFVLIGRGGPLRGASTRLRVVSCLFLLTAAPLAAEQATRLAWTKKFSSDAGDQVLAMATDSQGNIYVGGMTSSVNFPANGAYPSPRQLNLYRLTASSSELRAVGPSSADSVTAIGVGPGSSGVAYVATFSGLMRSDDNGNSWQMLTPPGWISNITVDPRDARVAYIAVAGSSVFKTADKGSTWSQLLDDPGTYSVTLDWLAPEIIYASGYSGKTLRFTDYRSDDGGQTWTYLQNAYLPRIVTDASASGVLYGWGSDAGGMAPYHLERSTDRGASWVQMNTPNNCDTGEILSDPVRRPNLYLLCTDQAYRSQDRGSTWANLHIPLQSGDSVAQGAVDLSLPLLYVISRQGSVLLSRDGGDSWTVATSEPDFTPTSVAANGGYLYMGTMRSADGFAAKLSPQGDLVWATYIGGSRADAVSSIALDDSGYVYVAGNTDSNDFPVPSGAYDGGLAAGHAGFVVKLSPDGSQVVYSARIKLDGALNGLAVDGSGGAYVTGSTFGGIVNTPGTVDPGTSDVPVCPDSVSGDTCPARAFLTKLAPSGTSLSYSTYLTGWPQAGEPNPSGQAVVVDEQGNAIVAGSALWKVNAAASSLVYATAVPGYGNSPNLARFQAAILDKAGNLIVGGSAEGGYLYTTAGVWKPWADGGTDGFLAKYDGNGGLIACTSMGAPVSSLALASDGTVITGGPLGTGSYYTRSMLEGPLGDSWFGRYSSDFSQLLFSSFVGAFSSGNGPYVAGLPDSSPMAIARAQDYSITLFATQTSESSAPRIDQIINEANSFTEAVSPSERIIVYGAGFGSGGARLLIGGADAQIVSQSDNTIVAVAPNVISDIIPDAVVEASGRESQTVPMPEALSSGVLYRANLYPDPQALVFNQDGTLNSQANPAAQGSVIAVAVNGPGSYTISGSSLVFAWLPPFIFLNGQVAAGVDANLLPAPGFPGLLPFIKVQVPDLAVTAPTSVTLQVGIPAPGPVGLSMWIK